MLILVIDDVALNLKLMEHLIRRLPDCTPVLFEASADALQWCIDNDPDLVIVDYMMPEMDGIAFIEARFVIDAAGVDQSAIRRLDEFLSVGTGNGSSLVDAIHTDVSFGGTVQGLTMEPGDYDADNVTAELLVTFIAMKQGAEV